MADWQDDPIAEAPLSSSPPSNGWQNDPVVNAPSELESAARGAANNFPLAPQAIAGLEPGDYSKNLSNWNQKAAEAKAANPISYGAGATAGTLAPLLVPGVGEAMEAAPVASGSLLGAANAVSNEDLKANPGEAAKKALIGAGVGGLTSGLTDAILPEASTLENKAAKTDIQSVNLPAKLLGNMEPAERNEMSQFLRDNGILNSDSEQAKAAAEAAQEKYGKMIGDVGAGSIKPNDETMTDQLLKLNYAAKELRQLGVPEATKQANLYEQAASAIEKNGNSWDNLQKIKSFYGDQAFDSAHQVKNKAAADAYGAIKTIMSDMADTAEPKYKAALKGYKFTGDILDGLTRKVGAEAQGFERGPIGMIGRTLAKMPGQKNPLVNLPTASLIAASGHPFMAVGAASPTFTNPIYQGAALRGLARAVSPEAKAGLKALINNAANAEDDEMLKHYEGK